MRKKTVMASDFKVVMLADSSELSKIMYNGLKKEFWIVRVLVENDISSIELLQKRTKRLGLLRTVGQVMFVAANRIFALLSAKKISTINHRYGSSPADYPQGITVAVDSINDDEVIQILKEVNPDAVVVNGTRIISQRVLDATDAVFLNTHVGITPRYRGVHGGYWALVNNDKSNCGVTVHLVDKGIDTGGVLYQDTIEVGRFDNLNTYPFHQIAKAIPLMKAALRDVATGNIRVKPGVGPSRLWTHPTLMQYLRFRALRRVK